MKQTSRNILLWLPRILTVLFAFFIALFALDVFNEFSGFWETLAALLIHLIPSFIVLIILFFAWKREWIGAILFFSLAVWYVAMAYGKFPFLTYVLICGPLILIAILFLLNWMLKNQFEENK